MVLIGIIAPILVFLLTTSLTYAYFTATTNNDETDFKTGVLKIALTKTSDEIFEIGSSGTQDIEYLLPGDSISANAQIRNDSDFDVYVIISFKVTQTVSGTATDLINNFFTIVEGEAVKISETNSTYSPTAFEILKNGTSETVSLVQEFDFWEIGNSYSDAEVTYSVNAYAIQKSSIESAEEATKLLIETFS